MISTSVHLILSSSLNVPTVYNADVNDRNNIHLDEKITGDGSLQVAGEENPCIFRSLENAISPVTAAKLVAFSRDHMAAKNPACPRVDW